MLRSDLTKRFICWTIPAFLKIEGLPQRLSSSTDSCPAWNLENTRKRLFSLKNRRRKLFVRLRNSLKQIYSICTWTWFSSCSNFDIPPTDHIILLSSATLPSYCLLWIPVIKKYNGSKQINQLCCGIEELRRNSMNFLTAPYIILPLELLLLFACNNDSKCLQLLLLHLYFRM